MRPIVALGILLLGLSGAAPEPEYSALFTDYLQAPDGDGGTSLVEIESSAGRSDRLAIAATKPRAVSVLILRPDTVGGSAMVASASPDFDSNLVAAMDVTSSTDSATGPDMRGTEVPLGDLCNALYTSAQANDLPIPFFANLIWQESRLRDDAVSKKGALGIAQFMPEVAVEKGLDDPFDPMKAIPASARFLRQLRLQFGNLGFVAAAYNAGAHRVAEWLERRGSLPQETRTYVVRVTGLSVDAWRSMPVDSDALTFVQHLPCRSLPAFASVEQTQSQEAQLDEAKLEQEDHDQPLVDDAAASHESQPHGVARGKLGRPARQEHREARHGGHEHHAAKSVSEHTAHAAHDKRRSA